MDCLPPFNQNLTALEAFVDAELQSEEKRDYRSFSSKLQEHRKSLEKSLDKCVKIEVYSELTDLVNKTGRIFNRALQDTKDEPETPREALQILEETGKLLMLAFAIKPPSAETIGKWSDNRALQVLGFIPNAEDSCIDGIDIYYHLNRYPDIVPFDKNRFKLTEGGYYNASDIRLADRRYILASAPREKELGIWRQMIIDSGCKSIFTLTNANERNIKKCFPFWKIGKPLSEETVFEKGEVKIIKRTLLFSEAVVQYHVVNWPDFGIVDSEIILKLHQLLDSENESQKHPPIIHCSAGVGRTGVLMASHLLLRDKEREIPIDIIGKVKELRSHRRHMVQTGPQLKMIACAIFS